VWQFLSPQRLFVAHEAAALYMITRNSVLNEIPQIVNQVSQLVQQKTITLPFKVSYGLSKNHSKAKAVEDEMTEFRTKEEREAKMKDVYVGNGKTIWEGQGRSQSSPKSSDKQHTEGYTSADNGDLPF